MRFQIAAVLSVMVIALLGCYPGEVFVSEVDTVATLYDPDANFSSYNTFHLPDTVVQIGENGDQLTDQYDQLIIDQTRSNLLNLGYTEVDIEEADLVITLEKSRSDLLVGWNPCPGCWCGYWCGYPGWGWGGGYNPWYPWGGTVVYSYPVGTIFTTMYDANAADAEEMQVPAVWSSTFQGLAQGSNIAQRIEQAIDQGFDQSPYLGK